MRVNETIRAALRPFKLPVYPDVYLGKAKEYFTFNYADDRGGDFGDGYPQTNVVNVQIQYFCSLSKDYRPVKEAVRESLHDAGFTWPEVVDASDRKEQIRHIVFTCEAEECRADYDPPEEGG